MRGWLNTLVVLALTSPAPALAEMMRVTVPAPVSVPALPADAKPQAVSFAKMAANIRPGTLWEEIDTAVYLMLPCTSVAHSYYWKDADNKPASPGTFDRVFRDEMQAAGFSGGGDSTNLFEEKAGSDLQVGALVTQLQARICKTANLIHMSYQGTSAMTVEWQVYSVSQGKVLVRVTTEGGARLDQMDDESGLTPLLSAAFADNVKRLAADDRFRQIVLHESSPAVAPATNLPALRFVPGSHDLPLAGDAKGVVSIFAGDGMGSGVLISPEGYLLTNHHVAGDQGRVRIRWPDGAETVGEVVRADKRRDVALVRTTPPRVEALAIRHSPVALGETVYAIGTPLEREFAGTLTRGVVSSTDRRLEGLSFIQSDVAVDHGNSGGPLLDEQGHVVGLTDLVYAPDGVSHNINFFIPIDDALKALGLVPIDAAAAATQSSGQAQTPRHSAHAH